MIVTRRRAIAIFASCLAAPASASSAQQWRGKAMGAEASIVLTNATPGSSFGLFHRIETIIAGIERQFSLHADSELLQLNTTGLLRHPSHAMRAVFALSDQVNKATAGAFDPTIQPLWLALAQGADSASARQLIGWDRVSFSADGISLPPGMQLTFNGIAQGYCADQVAGFLRGEGFDNVLVDTGETCAIGTRPDGAPWPVMITNPEGELLAHTTIANRAIATSSPLGMRLAGGEPHILSPRGQPPRWSTVSISAASAAVADALSTAACLLDQNEITHALASFPDARLETIA